MLVSPAYAQTGGGGGFDLVALLPLVLIFVVFYFLIIRPQQKKMKDHRAMLESIRRGDRVVTSGGIIGTVTRIDGDTEITVEIASGTRVKVRRGMIAEIMAKTEPADGKAADQEREKDKDREKAVEKVPAGPDYYDMLGLKKSATDEEIAAAGAAVGEDPVKAEAYATLSDPVRRKLYDSLGHADYVSRIKG